MFENKEDLFQGLPPIASIRLSIALVSAAGQRQNCRSVFESLLVFEQIFYEPIADSPHGTELMDISLSLASEIMTKKLARFRGAHRESE